jgi:hypothetical protein
MGTRVVREQRPGYTGDISIGLQKARPDYVAT